MSNTQTIEASIMYEKIKDVSEPTKALEILSKSEAEMGWNDSKDIRYLAYGLWLSKKGPEGWYDYFVKFTKVMQLLNLGQMPDEVPDTPAGWIAPIPYCRGDKARRLA